MTTAWLLPGGSAMGATQVGQAEALLSAGVEPDLLLGASAGALNAAWLAADPTLHGVDVLRQHWLEVSRRQVFPVAPVTLALGLAGRRDHTVSSDGLRRWLEELLPYRQIDEARLPLTITTTDLETGDAVHLTRGALIPALLASCALPGVYPPVTVGGRVLVDGGVAADPIGEAVAQGADRIYVLPTLGQSSHTRPKGAFGLLQRAVGLMLGASRDGEIASWADRCEIYLLPCPAVSGASPFSFRRGAELMETAREVATTWLATARPVAAPAPRPTRVPTQPPW